MSQPDLGEILAKAQQMQERLAEVQRELLRRKVEASAGGGMVTAVATGELRILEVRIDVAGQGALQFPTSDPSSGASGSG
jgi:DNA-binding protein YbaB